MRAVARLFAAEPDPVLSWLVEAADQLQAFAQCFLPRVQGTPVQLAALYALLRAVTEGTSTEAEAPRRLKRAPQGVWTAIDLVSTLLLAIEVGERPLALAQRGGPQVAQMLAPDALPLCLTDGHTDYLPAILGPCGHWVQPERRQATGPVPQPRGMPPASGARHAPRRVRDPGSGHPGAGPLWLAEQYVLCRAPHPRLPTPWGRERPSRHHAVQA